MTEVLITPERAYLEAIKAAGTAENVNGWLDKVDEIAGAILNRSKSFVRRETSIARRFEMNGVVIGVEDNPTAESGRSLNLFKVIFKSDIGERNDQMWLDKTAPGDVALFNTAKSLVGKRAHVTKLSKVQYLGEEPQLDDNGQPKTRPYLGAISPEGGTAPAPQAAAPASPAPQQQAAPSEDSYPEMFDSTAAPSTPVPTSAQELVNLAGQYFGLSQDDVVAEVEKILGPKAPGQRSRTPEELKKAWAALSTAHGVVAG